MESAALLSPELIASPEAFARPAGAAFPGPGGGRGPPQGFAGVLAAASDGGLPRGEDLPVGGNGLPLDAVLPAESEARLAAWLAVFDARALGLGGALGTGATDAAVAAFSDGAASGVGAARSASVKPPPGFGGFGGLSGEPLARALSVLEALVVRASADGAPAAVAAERGALTLPAGALDALDALSAPAVRGLHAGGAQAAAAAANLAAALADAAAAAAATAQRGDLPGAAQLAASVLRMAGAEQPAGFAPDAFAATRASAALTVGDPGARGSGALAALDVATATPADALLENSVRAPVAGAGVDDAASFAHRLGVERALADVLRPAGGTIDAAVASGTGVTPPHAAGAAGAASSSAAAAQGFDHVLSQANAQALDVRNDAWSEQLSGRIRWLVDRDVGEARIKLHPAELGSLDVKISVRDEQTFVQLAASNAAAREELEQSIPRLRELLGQMGLTLAGASVSGGRQEHAPYSAHGGYAAQANVTGVTEDELPTSLQRPRAADGRIDLYA